MKAKVLVLLGCFFIVFSLLSFQKKENNNKFVVVLDAGHGGKDPGNLGNNYKDSCLKSMNLASLSVKKCGTYLSIPSNKFVNSIKN